MREKKEAEVIVLKAEVEAQSKITEDAENQLQQADNEISSIFQMIPNLLDDRYVIDSSFTKFCKHSKTLR